MEINIGRPQGINFNIGGGSTPLPVEHPYTSLERLGTYLYKITFENIPEADNNPNSPIGGCTSYIQDGKLYRNFDWDYNNQITFHVVCKGFEGIATDARLVEGTALSDDILGQLPYHLADGVNDYGIKVSEHVLYNDFDMHLTGTKPASRLPYYILTTCKSINDLSYLPLRDLYIPEQLGEYCLLFLVSDGTTTKVITPTGSGYEIVDATDNPKLTNFKWVDREAVNRTDDDIQDRPTGIERWNSIPSDLSDLRFTKAYEAPNRLSEFIGINHTTKDSTDEELIAIYNSAHIKYIRRTRNGETWQTMHSVIYSNRLEALYVQEDYSKNYISTSDVDKAYVDSLLEHKQDLLTAGDGINITNNVISVNVINEVTDSMLPITSSAVNVTVGNINSILTTI